VNTSKLAVALPFIEGAVNLENFLETKKDLFLAVRGIALQTKVGCGGGEVGAAGWGRGAVDAGYVDAFLAAALTRVMHAAVPIPAVAAASVWHSAAVGGSVVGDVGPL